MAMQLPYATGDEHSICTDDIIDSYARTSGDAKFPRRTRTTTLRADRLMAMIGLYSLSSFPLLAR